jgi:hypothetical protein
MARWMRPHRWSTARAREPKTVSGGVPDALELRIDLDASFCGLPHPTAAFTYKLNRPGFHGASIRPGRFAVA